MNSYIPKTGADWAYMIFGICLFLSIAASQFFE